MARTVLFEGPDLSSHQGVVDMKQVKTAGCKWVALRAGYGKNNIDQKYVNNATACYNLEINTMLYWFSYGLDEQMAANEGGYAVEQAKKYWEKCPIAFDLEYDTIRYARTKGVEIGRDLATKMAISFLRVVKENGYIPVLYTNRDYLRNYFDLDAITAAIGDVYVWYARYGLTNLPVSEENIPDIWQYTSKGSLAGVSGNVDLNRYYTDFNSVSIRVEEISTSKTCNLNILAFQKAANADGYRDVNGKALVEDGIDGTKTQYVRRQIVLKTKKVGLWNITISYGKVVEWVQTRCSEILGITLDINGEYDAATRKAVKEVQEKLSLEVDGIAGYNTIQALFYN